MRFATRPPGSSRGHAKPRKVAAFGYLAMAEYAVFAARGEGG
jgi:hypothetical protein